MRPIYFALLAITCFAASPALAEHHNYIGIQGGITSPGDPDDFSRNGITATYSADTGYNVGLIVGRSYDGVRGELEFTHRASDTNLTISDGIDTDQGNTKYSAQSIMANGYLDFDRGHSITPYIGAGLGVVRAESDSFETTNFIGTNAIDTSLAYQVMLGANMSLSETASLNVGARYMGADNDVLPNANYELITGLSYHF